MGLHCVKKLSVDSRNLAGNQKPLSELLYGNKENKTSDSALGLDKEHTPWIGHN